MLLSREFLFLYGALATLLLLAIVPPLVSLNRYQRRIARSIGASLGRPVHLDRVTLNLLPLPGFTLENFVVDEDPAFGMEPIIRANTVTATLRVSSLWSRRVEFSRISFSEPSVNIVHTSDGKWNLDSILLQAARIDAAPTAQKKAGPAPRFPYIEAIGGRVNLKTDREKLPISLTDADFALWLPQPQQWHLRLKAHPMRTDTSVSDPGTVQVEGTLERAASLAQVPINLRSEWRGAPLGEVSRIVTGQDAGLRGDMTLSVNLSGTIGRSALDAHLQLNDAHRADFVPAEPMSFNLACTGTATNLFHSFEQVHCDWPPRSTSATQVVALNANLPDIRHLDTTRLQIAATEIPANTLVNWLHVASSRVPRDLLATGTLTGSLARDSADASTSGVASQTWQGSFLLSNLSVSSPLSNLAPITAAAIRIQSQPPDTRVQPATKRHPVALSHPAGFVLAPFAIDLGGKDPATLDGLFTAEGYSLHLAGTVAEPRLLALATALPQFGDGLADILPPDPPTTSTPATSTPVRLDLRSHRAWWGPQAWQNNAAAALPRKAAHRR